MGKGVRLCKDLKSINRYIPYTNIYEQMAMYTETYWNF